MSTNRRSHVHVVPDQTPVVAGEAPVEPSQESLAAAIERGDYLGILRAQRRDIALALPDERGPAKAALHRQLALISKEIQSLEERAVQQAKEDAGGVDIDDEAWDAEAL